MNKSKNCLEAKKTFNKIEGLIRSYTMDLPRETARQTIEEFFLTQREFVKFSEELVTALDRRLLRQEEEINLIEAAVPLKFHAEAGTLSVAVQRLVDDWTRLQASEEQPAALIALINKTCPNVLAKSEGCDGFSLSIQFPLDASFLDQKRMVASYVASAKSFRITRQTKDCIYYARNC